MFLKDSDNWQGVCSWSSDKHINKQIAAIIIKKSKKIATGKKTINHAQMINLNPLMLMGFPKISSSVKSDFKGCVYTILT